MDVADSIRDLAELEALYREPSERAANKVTDRIDAASAAFIDATRLIVIATGTASSLDASPRGGPAGFIQRLDDRHIAIPDLNGNNRLDTFRNILSHGFAGLLLMVPGKDETLRINGAATLTTNDEILDGFTTELRRPKLAMVVQTDELYGHCAKAFRRGDVWQPERWGAEAPDLASILACQFGTDADAVRTSLEDIYARDLQAD